ncbi:hypothetical protein ACROYT_G015603 [Oculina patagonica]
MMTDKTEQSKNVKLQYMSKEELLNLARKSAKELKYLQLKVKRLEEHKKKMIALGPKSDNDLKFLFLKLQKGVETRKEKLQNPVCKWGECQEKFENVEELFCHCKKHIDNLDTATIAPVNREYPCQWENCTKTYMKLKLLHNHIRDHTGNAKDEFLEILLKDQAKALNTTARQMRWHPLVIQWCLRIYCTSHSLYNEMRLSGALKLPSGRTLSDYKNFNSPKSGWHSETIEAMRTKFDKMKPPKHAKLGGLFLMKSKLKKINRVFWLGVSMLHSHNFEVILACCDGASPNRSFVTMNTTNETHSKGFNPFSGYPIFFFSDPPHLIKKLRNNLYKSGFKEQNKRFTRTMRRNGKYILWDHIVAVFNGEKKRCLFATDLRNSHINLDNLSKMRVKLAVQTLSSKVADEMSKFENNDTLSTQEYIVQCEKFWKVFNDQTPIRVETDVRIHMLEEVLAYFVEWKESLPAMYDTKSEQGQHFIAWQTMFDLQMDVLITAKTEMLNKLDKLENAQSTINKDGEDLKKSFQETELQIQESKSNLLLKADKTEVEVLKEKIDDLENRSKRNNVVIWGIQEGSEKDYTSMEEFIEVELFQNHMKVHITAFFPVSFIKLSCFKRLSDSL